MFFITNMSTSICASFTQDKSGKGVLLLKCLKKIKGNCEEQLSEQTCHPTVN